MTSDIDIPHVREAIHLLTRCSPESCLLQLKNLCVNNGIWTVPELPGDYQPVLFEVSLFGVPAIADEAAKLPVNWLKAAGNILKRLPDPDHSGPDPSPNAEALKPAA